MLHGWSRIVEHQPVPWPHRLSNAAHTGCRQELPILHGRLRISVNKVDGEAAVSAGYTPFLCFHVQDLDKTVYRLIDMSAILDGPVKYPSHGKIATLRAPGGHMLGLMNLDESHDLCIGSSLQHLGQTLNVLRSGDPPLVASDEISGVSVAGLRNLRKMRQSALMHSLRVCGRVCGEGGTTKWKI